MSRRVYFDANGEEHYPDSEWDTIEEVGNDEQEFVRVDRKYLMELEQKAKDCEYFRGQVHGMEYVVDALQEALKGKEDK